MSTGYKKKLLLQEVRNASSKTFVYIPAYIH